MAQYYVDTKDIPSMYTFKEYEDVIDMYIESIQFYNQYKKQCPSLPTPFIPNPIIPKYIKLRPNDWPAPLRPWC